MNPLTPAKPKTMPTGAGQVFERSTGNPQWSTFYLSCAKRRYDEFTGEKLPEPVWAFIVFQGDLMFRTQLTEAEVTKSGLTERRAGLPRRHMAAMASMAFREWEQNEYRRIGVLKSWIAR
jgi:hypothetical protein